MDLKNYEGLSVDEKIRLFNGDGNWNSFSAGGRLPVITMSDGPHGLRMQGDENYADINNSREATCFPTASCSACSWNRKTLYEIGRGIALEAKKNGVNLLLGPGMNIKRSPLCGRNFEYFSEDPYLSGVCAASYTDGLQENGVGSCLKHFACNNQEKRRQTSNSIVDLRALNEIYLRGFEYAVKKSSPCAIMTSYNRVNASYVCHHPYFYKKLKEWNFKGLVVSDWGAAIDSASCLKEGMGLSMPDSSGYFQKSIKKALEDGRISEKDIENANLQVLKAAERFPKQKDFSFNQQEQQKTALLSVLDSAVLLKNDGILPLKKGSSVIVGGKFSDFPRIQGGGSSHVNVKSVTGIKEALKSEGVEICEFSLSADASIPVLFFCGLDDFCEGEGFDRSSMVLPEDQLKAFRRFEASGRNIILISFSGSPYDLSFASCSSAILQMYLGGQEVSTACAQLLCGSCNPSGRLAETWPKNGEKTPWGESFGGKEDNILYSESIFTGYRYYDFYDIPVQFEFGYGLSYTTFEYSDLKITDEGKKISFMVKNTGNREGAEVCQIYVKNPLEKDVSQSVPRAKKELKGFEKIFLKPGEEKLVSVELDEYAFSVFSTKQNCFVKVQGEYEICVSSSLNDVRLSQRLFVEGQELESLFENDYSKPKSEWFLPVHRKGDFVVSDSLMDMSRRCVAIKLILLVFTAAIRIMNFGKSSRDPAVKIAISAIQENPLESLISTSGGMINYGFAKFIVRIANSSLF